MVSYADAVNVLDAEKDAMHQEACMLERHNPNSFIAYVTYIDHSNLRLGNDLVSKLNYYKKCKEYTIPKVQEELAKDPHYQYFAQCQQDMELAKAILERVHNKTLRL